MKGERVVYTVGGSRRFEKSGLEESREILALGH